MENTPIVVIVLPGRPTKKGIGELLVKYSKNRRLVLYMYLVVVCPPSPPFGIFYSFVCLVFKLDNFFAKMFSYMYYYC